MVTAVVVKVDTRKVLLVVIEHIIHVVLEVSIHGDDLTEPNILHIKESEMKCFVV
jgi:hypothetical protein